MKYSELAKALGSRGGKARAKRLNSKEKKLIASAGGKARVESLRLAKRIEINFRYANTLKEMASPIRVSSVSKTHKKLPGFYAK